MGDRQSLKGLRWLWNRNESGGGNPNEHSWEPTGDIVMNKSAKLREARKAAHVQNSSAGSWTGLKGFNNWEDWEEKPRDNFSK